MSTYKELIAQRDQLDEEIFAARRSEIGPIVAHIRQLMAEYELTPEDLGFHASPPSAGIAIYRDPVSGATWSGKGREPAWISGKDHEAFRVW